MDGTFSTDVERDDAAVAWVGERIDFVDTRGYEATGAYFDVHYAVDFGGDAGEALRECLRVEITRKINEVTNPIK